MIPTTNKYEDRSYKIYKIFTVWNLCTGMLVLLYKKYVSKIRFYIVIVLLESIRIELAAFFLLNVTLQKSSLIQFKWMLRFLSPRYIVFQSSFTENIHRTLHNEKKKWLISFFFLNNQQNEKVKMTHFSIVGFIVVTFKQYPVNLSLKTPDLDECFVVFSSLKVECRGINIYQVFALTGNVKADLTQK